MTAAAERRDDPRTRSLAIRADPPPRAAADQRRRPVRAVRGGRGRLRADRRHQRHARGDAGGGDPRRSRPTAGEAMPTRMAIVAMGRYGGYELGYGSDADVMFVHDPLPGCRRAAGRVDGPGRGQRHAPAARRASRATRRSRSTPACGPRASRGRWCAPSTPTRPTTASGRRSGRRRRCCAPRRRR